MYQLPVSSFVFFKPLPSHLTNTNRLIAQFLHKKLINKCAEIDGTGPPVLSAISRIRPSQRQSDPEL